MERLQSKFLLSLFALLAAATLIGCGGNTSGKGSKLTIRFPSSESSASSHAGKVSALAYDFAKICYLVNVTAADLPGKRASTCDIPFGVFSGFVPPGGEVSIDVPRGKDRKLEVLAYTRSTALEVCPTSAAGFGKLDRSRIAKVGEVARFDATEAIVNVTVDVAAPASGTSVVTQYSLPATCVAAAHSTRGTAGIVAGAKTVSSTNFKIKGVVTNQSNQLKMQSTSFQVQLNRSGH